jgi:hypothetical protein
VESEIFVGLNTVANAKGFFNAVTPSIGVPDIELSSLVVGLGNRSSKRATTAPPSAYTTAWPASWMQTVRRNSAASIFSQRKAVRVQSTAFGIVRGTRRGTANAEPQGYTAQDQFSQELRIQFDQRRNTQPSFIVNSKILRICRKNL